MRRVSDIFLEFIRYVLIMPIDVSEGVDTVQPIWPVALFSQLFQC